MIGVTILLGLGIFGAAYLGNSLLQKQANKLVGLKLDSKVAVEQESSLAQAKKDIAKYSELESEAKVIVPQDKDQAEAVKEIVKIASGSGIKLGSISFPTSTLGQKATKSSGSSKSSSSTAKVPFTQVEKVTDIPGLYSMSITVQSSKDMPVTYNDLINFLNRLEQNRRTAQVTGVTITPDSKNPNNLSFSLIINLYIKP